MQEYRDAQEDAEIQCLSPQRFRQPFEVCQRQFAPVAADEDREQRLFALGETRHVQISDQIGPVLLIVAVRDGKADLMEAGGPS